MKNILAAVVIGVSLPAVALAQAPTCRPPCVTGSSCCVVQYSNGQYSSPYCKSGSCYNTKSDISKFLENAKEIPASKAAKTAQ
jgi:hypothetical protein